MFDALTDVVLVVALSVAERDPEAAEFIGDRLRGMLSEQPASQERFAFAFTLLTRFEKEAARAPA